MFTIHEIQGCSKTITLFHHAGDRLMISFLDFNHYALLKKINNPNSEDLQKGWTGEELGAESSPFVGTPIGEKCKQPRSVHYEKMDCCRFDLNWIENLTKVGDVGNDSGEVCAEGTRGGGNGEKEQGAHFETKGQKI